MIAKFFHFGVSVTDLDIATNVLVEEFGLKVHSRRKIEHEYIGSLVGVSGAKCEIVMIDAGNDTFIELLDWDIPQGLNLSGDESIKNLTSSNSSHICLYVDDIERTLENVKGSNTSSLIGSGITTVPIGPNIGARVFFVKSFDGIFIELFQKASN